VHRNAVSRILLLLIFLLWMAWTPQATASLGLTPRPRTGPAVFLGFYLLLIAVMRLWSELLARRVTHENLNRSLRGFGRVLLVVRFLIPAWFGVGVFALGWGRLIEQFAHYWKPLQLPGLLIGTLPAFAAWAGMWWSQYPADRSLREHNLLDELEADLPVHAPPSFRNYFTSNLRLQLLFTAIPVFAIILTRDVLAFAVRAVRGPGALPPDSPLEFAVMLLSTATVFLLAPEILRRVLQTQPLPDSPLRRRLEALCDRVGMRYRDILLWRTQNHMGNAAVMGIVPQVRYILLSDLLLERMDDEQIEAVFAHEVGHVMHRHMAWYVVVIMIFFFGLVVVDHFVARQLPVFAEVPEALVTVLSLMAGGILFLVYFGFISRRFERQADVYAARLIEANAKAYGSGFRLQGSAGGVVVPGAPEPRTLRVEPSLPSTASHVGPYGAMVFASALHRVAVMNNIPLAPRRRPRRGFFRRLGHSVDGVVESLHNWLHGSIHHRMEYLRGLSADPALTGRFDRFMVRLYFALLVALFACAAFVFVSNGPFH
jgi:STE24 endopeptidase